jgi:hypothetical protein
VGGWVYAGSPFDLTVTAADPFDKTVYVYRGTVIFDSSDPDAELPLSYTFTAADAGVHVFQGLTLNTPGPQTIYVQDVGDPTKLGGTDLTVF